MKKLMQLLIPGLFILTSLPLMGAPTDPDPYDPATQSGLVVQSVFPADANGFFTPFDEANGKDFFIREGEELMVKFTNVTTTNVNYIEPPSWPNQKIAGIINGTTGATLDITMKIGNSPESTATVTLPALTSIHGGGNTVDVEITLNNGHKYTATAYIHGFDLDFTNGKTDKAGFFFAVEKVVPGDPGPGPGPGTPPYDVNNEVALYIRTKDTVSPFTAIKLTDGSDWVVDSEKIKLEITYSPITALPDDIRTTEKYVTLVGKLAKNTPHKVTVMVGTATPQDITIPVIPDEKALRFPFDITVGGKIYTVTLSARNTRVRFKDTTLPFGYIYILSIADVKPKIPSGPGTPPFDVTNEVALYIRTKDTASPFTAIKETDGSDWVVDSEKIKLEITPSPITAAPGDIITTAKYVNLVGKLAKSTSHKLIVKVGTNTKDITIPAIPDNTTTPFSFDITLGGKTYDVTLVAENTEVTFRDPTLPLGYAYILSIVDVKPKTPSGPGTPPFDVTNEVALYIRTKDTASPFTAIKETDGSDWVVNSEKIKLEITPSPLTAAPGDIITTAKYVNLVGKLAKSTSHKLIVKVGTNTKDITIPANIPDGTTQSFPLDVTIGGNTYTVTLAAENRKVTFKDPAFPAGNAYIITIVDVKPKIPTPPSGPGVPFDVTNEVAVYIQASDANNPANAVTDTGGPFISHAGTPLPVKIGIAAGLTKREIGSKVQLPNPILKFIGVIDKNNPSRITVNLGGRPGEVTLPLGIGTKTSLPTVVIDLYKVNLTVEKQNVTFPTAPGITGSAYVIKAQITPPTRQEILDELRRRRH